MTWTRRLASSRLEEAFANCPECGTPWKYHWIYEGQGSQLRRHYNTCDLAPGQLEVKWINK